MIIESVKYLGEYKLEVTFEDGQVKVADLKRFLSNAKGPCIRKYLNKRKFQKVTVISGFLSWNKGEMELFPLEVYHEYCHN